MEGAQLYRSEIKEQVVEHALGCVFEEEWISPCQIQEKGG